MGQYDAQVQKAWAAVNRTTPLQPIILQVYNSYMAQYGYQQTVENMLSSNECANNVKPLCRLYQALLTRKPDPIGLDYHVTNFISYLAANGNNRGPALALVADQFMNAPEFLALYPAGLNNEQFITACYVNTLRRLPEDGVVPYWISRLNNGETRSQIIVSFSESQEFVNATFAGVNAMLRGAANDDPNAYVGNLF